MTQMTQSGRARRVSPLTDDTSLRLTTKFNKSRPLDHLSFSERTAVGYFSGRIMFARWYLTIHKVGLKLGTTNFGYLIINNERVCMVHSLKSRNC